MRTRPHTSGDRTGNLPPPTSPIRIWTSSQTTGWASPLTITPYADLAPPPRRPYGYSSTTTSPYADQTPPIWRPYGYFTSITLPNADLDPPPDDRTGIPLSPHHTLCGSGPSPQTTVRAFSPSPHRPMRIWTSSQTTVRADYHQCHHTPLPSSGEQHIRSQT